MRKLLRALVWTAILLALLGAGLRAVALREWRVPDDDPFLEASVAPTLRSGDLVLLWRLTEPKVGNLVLCPEPDAPERVVVGRIAAEAAERIAIEASDIWIEDERVPTERSCPSFVVVDPNTGQEVEQSCEVEALGKVAHARGQAAGPKASPQRVAHEVLAGKVFLVSDNRSYPYDSRDYGAVDRATCRETVVFRVMGAEGFADVERRFTFIR